MREPLLPPAEEEVEPFLVLWEPDLHLHLLARGDAALKGTRPVQDAPDERVIGIARRIGEFAVDEVVRETHRLTGFRVMRPARQHHVHHA